MRLDRLSCFRILRSKCFQGITYNIFLIIVVKTSERICLSSHFICIFLSPYSPAPPFPSFIPCLYLTALLRACIELNRRGVVVALVTPYPIPHTDIAEAVKSSCACQAWNFDIERKASVTAPHRWSVSSSKPARHS